MQRFPRWIIHDDAVAVWNDHGITRAQGIQHGQMRAARLAFHEPVEEGSVLGCWEPGGSQHPKLVSRTLTREDLNAREVIGLEDLVR
ncbi:hypothetical protein GCM10027027_21950 [Neomicrococcus lactis]